MDYWKKTAEHDYETMQTLFVGKRYDATLFFGHIILEKMLKALIAHKIGEQAPYTHDLVRLAKIAHVELSEEEMKLLNEVNDFNIEARYPAERLEFYHRCTREYTKRYVDPIDYFYKRLCRELKPKKS